MYAIAYNSTDLLTDQKFKVKNSALIIPSIANFMSREQGDVKLYKLSDQKMAKPLQQILTLPPKVPQNTFG